MSRRGWTPPAAKSRYEKALDAGGASPRKQRRALGKKVAAYGPLASMTQEEVEAHWQDWLEDFGKLVDELRDTMAVAQRRETEPTKANEGDELDPFWR